MPAVKWADEKSLVVSDACSSIPCGRIAILVVVFHDLTCSQVEITHVGSRRLHQAISKLVRCCQNSILTILAILFFQDLVDFDDCFPLCQTSVSLLMRTYCILDKAQHMSSRTVAVTIVPLELVPRAIETQHYRLSWRLGTYHPGLSPISW